MNQSMELDAKQIEAVSEIAWEAGDRILTVYDSDEFDVEAKGDGSPLTRADRLAHQTILDGLSKLTPQIPILSEESGDDAFQARSGWTEFWLVDPLDGTKEFIKRNGEFTVNIALVTQRQPVFGVVVAPVLDRCYFGGPGRGAYRRPRQGSLEAIQTRPYRGGRATVVASRSHRGEAVDAFIDALTEREQDPEVKSMGSSLKLCLVAEGSADVYPRLGPTSEWDTAAAHAVALGAGGKVTDVQGAPLVYNKESILNPWFLVAGSGDYTWIDLLPAGERS